VLGLGFALLAEDGLRNLVVADLLVFDRAEGGRIEEAFPVVLPVELGGLVEVVVLRVVGLTGNRLGD
jgi:hypothetical protein